MPLTLEGYALGVYLPPAAIATATLGAFTALFGALLSLRGRGGWGSLLVAAGAGLAWMASAHIPYTNPELFAPHTLARVAIAFEGVQSFVVAALAIAFAAPLLLERSAGRQPRAFHALLAVLFFHTLMSFEIFPRAGHNVWLLQGALSPATGWVLYRCWRTATPTGASRVRRVAAAALVAIIPVWLAYPILVTPFPTDVSFRGLDLPKAGGLRFDTREVERLRLDRLADLVDRLSRIEPRDAPLFLATNDRILPYLTDRPTLFPEREFTLFLLAWGMVPRSEMPDLDVDLLVRRLRTTPDALVIDRKDQSSRLLRAALPRVARVIDVEFEQIARVGPWKVLRRRPDPGPL
jgi:hypothetical protein